MKLKPICHKLSLLVLLNLTFGFQVFSQSDICEVLTYSYDEVGNRILRYPVIVICDDGNPGGQARLGQSTEETEPNTSEYSGIVVFPNPTENHIIVKGENRQLITELHLFDVLGKMVTTLKPNSNQAMMPLEDLSNGVYLLSVVCEGKKQNFKIIKK